MYNDDYTIVKFLINKRAERRRQRVYECPQCESLVVRTGSYKPQTGMCCRCSHDVIFSGMPLDKLSYIRKHDLPVYLRLNKLYVVRKGHFKKANEIWHMQESSRWMKISLVKQGVETID